MNTLNLQTCKVSELSSSELQETNGGSYMKMAIAIACDLIDHGAEYWAAFKRGFASGSR
jgi:hypothetical protein